MSDLKIDYTTTPEQHKNQSTSTDDDHTSSLKTPGWIKLHRKIIEWEWFSTPHMFRFWTYLIIHANYHDTRFRGHAIKRGQLVFGRLQAAKDLKISIQSIRTCLEHLKSTSQITIKSTNKFSIITICNYDKYQDCPTSEQPANQPANQQTTNHIQELKKIKNNTAEHILTLVEPSSDKPKRKTQVSKAQATPWNVCPEGKVQISNLLVFLTPDEKERFKADYPDVDRMGLCQDLNDYKLDNETWANRHRDDNRTLRNWLRRREIKPL